MHDNKKSSLLWLIAGILEIITFVFELCSYSKRFSIVNLSLGICFLCLSLVYYKKSKN